MSDFAKAVSILNTAHEKGIDLFIEDGRLKFRIVTGDNVDAAFISHLKEHKERLFDFLSNHGGNLSGEPEMKAVREEHRGRIPLSYSQERLWTIDQLKGSREYHLYNSYRCYDQQEIEAIAYALNEMVNRHEVLRTVIKEENGTPYQVVLPRDTWSEKHFNTEDVSEESLQEKVETEKYKPFDLAMDHMLRAKLFRIKDNGYLLTVLTHHIAADGWSENILMSEILAIYQARKTNSLLSLPPLTLQYADYAIWQRSYLNGEVLKQRLSYWTKQLAGTPVLELPFRYPRLQTRGKKGHAREFEIEKELTAGLHRLAKKEGVTLFMLLLSVFKVLLYRYSGQTDICLGTPSANRTRKEIEPLIGFFVNTLVIRSDLSGNPVFTSLLSQIRNTTLKAYEYQDVPFEKIVDQLAPEREGDVNPLFQVMFDLPDIATTSLKGNDASQDEMTKFDLSFSIREREGKLHVKVKYSSGIFDTSALTAFCMHYRDLLYAVIKDPAVRIDDLNILTLEESHRILRDFNNTAMASSHYGTIVEMFREQVKRTPDNIALVAGAEEWTYARLNEVSDRLAVYLRELRGIGRNDLVGLQLERDSWMIIAILGILKSGAAYVPIEPDYPQERVTFILEDSHCRIVIDKEELERFNSTPLKSGTEITCSPDDLAYVIYTSGSTGYPKGVMVEHHSVVNLIISQLQTFGIDHTENILQFSNIAFDASVEQILLALLSGARLTLVDKATRVDPELLAAFISTHKITHIHMVPAMLRTLPIRHYPALRRVIAGGDSCPRTLAEAWGRHYPFYNEYGPTETTVTATEYLYVNGNDDQMVLPIGRPLGNTAIYIMDKQQRLVPPGIKGEIYIGGIGVARGYLNRPELTEQKFIADPFIPGDRMYRTGDLGKWLPDGNIMFLGRSDDQVKIRGHRIELGEIEAVLRTNDHISDAVVTVRDQNRLMAFVIPAGTFDGIAIREWLKTKLPDYMIPVSITALDTFPLNANAKVDRQALPDVYISTIAFEAPRNEIEQLLAQIWCELLRVTAVGMHENFFELGGDSITSIQMVSRLNRYGYTLHPQDIFDCQTIAKLSARLQQLKLLPPAAEQGMLSGRVGLLPIQRWFLDLDYKEKSHFSQAQLFRLDKNIQLSWLSSVIDALVRQHDTLRLTYSRNEDGWYQYYGDIIPDVDVEDMTEVPQSEFSTMVTSICNRYRRSLDIGTGRLIRVVLLKTPAYEPANRLFIVIHHLAVDGVSWRILLQQFQEAISMIAAGGTIELGTKSNSYREWVDALKRYTTTDILMSQLEYWKGVVKAYTPLPLSRAKGKEKLNYTVILDKTHTTSLLHEVNQAYHTEINDILLAALAYTFCNWTGKKHLVAGMEGHGREYINREIDVSNTVGWFTTEYPLLLEVEAGMDIADLVVAVKEQLRRIPQKGIGYGLLRYLHPDQEINNVLADGKWDIVFNYLGQIDNIITENSQISQAAENKGENFDYSYPPAALIDITGIVRGGELILHWGYAGDDNTVISLADKYIDHLRLIIEHCRNVENKKLTPSDYGLAPEVGYRELDGFIRSNESSKGKIVDLYRLSPLQKGLLFHHQYDDNDKAYLEQMCIDFTEGLDIDIFIRSWNHIIKEHTILRSSFIADAFDIPVQCVYEHATIPYTVIDLLHLDETARQQEVENILKEDLGKGMDFSRAPLMRITLIKLSAQYYRMIWTHHHIILDGWSNPVLISGFMRAYTAFTAGQLPLLLEEDRYGDYIRYIGKSDRLLAETFWKDYLSGLNDKTLLPFTAADATVRNRGGSKISYKKLTIDSGITGRIRQYCQEHQLTVNTFIQGTWSLLLSRYTGNPDTAFGVIVSGRPADLDNVEHRVGLYINNLPLRSVIKKGQPVKEWLKTIQNGHTAARDHQYVALNDIQHWSGFSGDFYDTLLIFQNYPAYAGQEDRQILKVAKKHLDERTNYLLTIMVGLHDELSFNFGYNSDILDGRYVEQIKGHFECVITELLDQPTADPVDINILSQQEQQQLLRDFNVATIAEDCDEPITSMFAKLVEKTPQHTAIICEGRHISYLELQNKADRMALYLQQQYNCNSKHLVGISLQADEWLVISILAVLKTGAGYVPMDTDLPEDRISFILSDANCQLLINEDILRSFKEQQDRYQTDRPILPDTLSDTLAVIYTSGSASVPKGVMLSHSNMLNRLHWMWKEYPFAQHETACFKTSISFVDHMWELFGPLLKGVPLVVFPKQVLLDTDRFINDLAAYSVTRIVLVTSLLKEILVHKDAGKLSALKYWTCSGEVLPQKVIAAFYERYKEHILLNIWGATEVMADATCYDTSMVSAADVYATALTGTIIGKPIANFKLYVLSDDLALLPVGVAGQICVAGKGLAIGYLNQPELNKTKFIPHPFDPDSRLYLSGDMGRWLPDGNLEIVGRKDTQVKIRGNRVELAEIEHALLKQKDIVHEAIVDAREWKGQTVIVAYIVSGGVLQKDILRERLARELPSYMIPAYFVEIATLPRTISGKINRRALPDISETDMVKKQYMGPRNIKESVLVTAWESILGVTDIGVMDNFYELGGNSIRAMQIVSRLKQEGWMLGIVQLLQKPQIAELANYIQQISIQQTEKLQHLRGPLSLAQEGYYSRTDYIHAAGLFSLRLKPYDKEKWMRVLRTVCENIGVLHMMILDDGKDIIQQPVQTAVVTPDITFIETSGYSNNELKDLLMSARCKPFDLANGRGMRIYVCEEGQQAVVYILIHHVLTDDISNRLLRNYFEQLYYNSNIVTPLDGNANFAFANSIRSLMASSQGEKQLRRWMEILETATSQKLAFKLPDTYKNPMILPVSGCNLRIQKTGYKNIRQYCAAAGVTVSSWMLSVLGLYQYLTYQQTTALLIDIITDGREIPLEGFAAETAVGQFSNIVPVYLLPEMGITFRTFLIRTHAAHLSTRELQLVPGKIIRDTFNREQGKDLSQHISGLLNYREMTDQEMPAEDPSSVVIRNGDSRYPMNMKCDVYANGVLLRMMTKGECFKEMTILQHLIDLFSATGFMDVAIRELSNITLKEPIY
ncbi:non-ribosomal peptide synthase domain TIGR01720/amino acid adenylation domain-containing protein [Chitinophaga sp. YR573]|uniref:non-ribosomal peptide synthetase n=1 Tax=Chitinophaga sp. YR573 TaxID=1881040 RepID=UPI0008C648CC|nr:non-ribosomal peptide synthetase [Chitinophaga sp. YR573]SEW42715.1 non-ribosomal peptide synthase domain TIGR01720/amino acid adenylation domain-containing protein [Chitinophaga sp. YR573]